MSKEVPTVLVFAEKISGIIIAIIGLLLINFTYTSMNAAGITALFFIAVGVLLIVLGFILLIVKME